MVDLGVESRYLNSLNVKRENDLEVKELQFFGFNSQSFYRLTESTMGTFGRQDAGLRWAM